MRWRISGRENGLDFPIEFPVLEDVAVLMLPPLGKYLVAIHVVVKKWIDDD